MIVSSSGTFLPGWRRLCISLALAHSSRKRHLASPTRACLNRLIGGDSSR